MLNYALFRQPVQKAGSIAKVATGGDLISSDVEDIISSITYLKLFNAAFKKQLGEVEIAEANLPAGDRIVNRINRYLADNSIQLRPSGGFNHYTVANCIVSKPPSKVDHETLNRFELLFEIINNLYLCESGVESAD